MLLKKWYVFHLQTHFFNGNGGCCGSFGTASTPGGTSFSTSFSTSATSNDKPKEEKKTTDDKKDETKKSPEYSPNMFQHIGEHLSSVLNPFGKILLVGWVSFLPFSVYALF